MAISPRPAPWNRPTTQEWLSLQQAAHTYGISVDTIRRRIATGQLPASRCGGRMIRVRIVDLDDLFRPLTTSVGYLRSPRGTGRD